MSHHTHKTACEVYNTALRPQVPFHIECQFVVRGIALYNTRLTKDDGPIMTWEPEIEELRRREAFAREMGGPERIQRQHDNGRLTVRERMDRLLDAETFHEVGALAGKAEYDKDGQLIDFMAANFVFGSGRITGRKVMVGGDDFTIRGGAADAGIRGKMSYCEKMALELRLPMIRLVDGTGGGGSVKTLEMIGRTYVPAMSGWDTVVALMSAVPVVAACMGSVCWARRGARGHIAFLINGEGFQPTVRRGAAGR